MATRNESLSPMFRFGQPLQAKPPINYQNFLQWMINMVVVVLFWIGCDVPVAAQTPIPMPEINTSVTTLVITEVQRAVTDHFPPGCDTGPPLCYKTKESYQVLIVWFGRKDGGDPYIVDQLSKEWRGVYVTAGDGSSTGSFSIRLVDNRLYMVFMPPAAASTFKLVWPVSWFGLETRSLIFPCRRVRKCAGDNADAGATC